MVRRPNSQGRALQQEEEVVQVVVVWDDVNHTRTAAQRRRTGREERAAVRKTRHGQNRGRLNETESTGARGGSSLLICHDGIHRPAVGEGNITTYPPTCLLASVCVRGLTPLHTRVCVLSWYLIGWIISPTYPPTCLFACLCVWTLLLYTHVC